MPRAPRIDVPGFHYHIFSRGIEKKSIFNDDQDRCFFLKSLGRILRETGTPIYAFTLIPNHFHLLLRRDASPIPNVMSRLLTAYAIYFNNKYERVGHLFQNRYKSYVCENETYFRELVRYIHLNPIRSGQVKNLHDLSCWPYAGHSYILGKITRDWFNPDRVWKYFGEGEREAVDIYRLFVESYVTDLSADDFALKYNEMVKSQSGASSNLAKTGVFEKEEGSAKQPDTINRIAANIDNVGKLNDIDDFIDEVCLMNKVSRSEVLGGTKRKLAVKARSELVLALSKEAGLPNCRIAEELGLSKSGVTMIMKRAASE